MATNAEIGAKGEQLASEYLHNNGFELIHRNWRAGRYEIDIVAKKGGILHFIEVKTRRSGSLTSAEDSITGAKFSSLIKAARRYIAEYGIDMDSQFDLIAVEYTAAGFDIRYIPDAMTLSW